MTGDETEALDDWARFWFYVAHGELRIPVCGRCGAANWYPASRCRQCGFSVFVWVELSGRVEVFLVMTVYRDFSGAERDLPYGIALVTPVEHASIRLVASAAADAELAAGDQGQLAIVEGLPTVGALARAGR